MCRFGGRGAGHLPVLLGILMVTTLVLSYILAVLNKDVDPLFPYISDTGTKIPESCVFGQLLNIGAFTGLIIIYLRYRLVKEFNRDADLALKRLNEVAFLLGFLAAFGMSLVANFQETGVTIVHYVGAFMCFGGGLVYALFHAGITYRMYPLYNGLLVCRIRLAIALLSLVAFGISLAFGIVASHQYHNHHPQNTTEHPHWRPEDPGYAAHVVSAVGEWTLACGFVLYFFTYIKDFDKLHVDVEVQPLVQHLDEVPVPPLNERSPLLI